MSELDSTTLDRAELARTIQRCAEAYLQIRAELRPKDVGFHPDLVNQQKASLAFIARLPILTDPASFQIYIACVARGVGIGAVDIADAGRLCHLAQTAMSAWKLANLTVPAAADKKDASQRKEARKKANINPSSADSGSPADPNNSLNPNDFAGSAHSAEFAGSADSAGSAIGPTPLPPKGNHPGNEVAPWEQPRRAASA